MLKFNLQRKLKVICLFLHQNAFTWWGPLRCIPPSCPRVWAGPSTWGPGPGHSPATAWPGPWPRHTSAGALAWTTYYTGHWRDHHMRHWDTHPLSSASTRAAIWPPTPEPMITRRLRSTKWYFLISLKEKKNDKYKHTSIHIHSHSFPFCCWPPYWLLIYPSLNQSPNSTLS